MKAVYCVLKMTDTWEAYYTLVQVFATRISAEEYLSKVKDKGLYKISLYKVF